MRELVAIDLPAGPAFVEQLRRSWDAGDAVFPVDRRLPAPARHAVLEAMAPSAIVHSDGVERVAAGRPVEADDALVVATSGSTGVPKGVVLTHRAVAASAAATSERLGVVAGDRWLACLPLAHVGGLSVVTRALLTDTPLVVHERFEPEAVASAAAEGATLVSLVPTALGRIDAALFRRIVLGGSAPPSRLPPNAVTTYGATETGSGVVYDGLALRGVEVAISPDREILLRGPMLLRSYRDGTDPKDVDGWYHSGDLGALDGEGRLTVFGRRSDLIITGGENVWPEPIEAVLRNASGIADVAVGAVADPEWGQRVVAYVVPTHEPPTLDSLRNVVKQRLAAFAAPRELVLVAEIPRTALGKVRRSELPALGGPAR